MRPTTVAQIFEMDSTDDGPYGTLAPLYDAVYADALAGYQADLVREAAPEDGADLLDMACGSGPLLGAVADEYDSVGLDRDPGMLAVAAERVDAPLVRADARQPPLSAKFDVAAMLGRSLSHLRTDARVRATVTALYDRLRRGGVAVVNAVARTGKGRYRHERTGETECYRVVRRTESAVVEDGHVRTTATYEARNVETGETRTFGTTYDLRAFAAEWLRDIFEAVGFEDVTVEGNGTLVVTARRS